MGSLHRHYLKSGGLTRDDVKVDFVDPAALWGTYTAKRADGLMSTVGSALPVAEAPRPSKCLLASDAGIKFPSYGLVAREETIAGKGGCPEVADRGPAAAWEHLRANPTTASRRSSPSVRTPGSMPTCCTSQIKLTLDYFDTPASKGKPIGWQAKEDWEAALKSMEAAGVVKPGWNAADYYTNALGRMT